MKQLTSHICLGSIVGLYIGLVFAPLVFWFNLQNYTGHLVLIRYAIAMLAGATLGAILAAILNRLFTNSKYF